MNLFGTTRGAGRRLISELLGRKGELAAHALYHRLLRATRRFAPPEDRELLMVLAAIANRSQTLLDVGANVGRYSWFLQCHAPPESVTYAFEPNPDAMMLLRSNLRCAHNVHCLQLALGDRDGDGVMEVPMDAMGNPVTALGWVTMTAAGGDELVAIEVGIRTLDSLVEDSVVRPIAPVFMKIDVEGGEQGVLNGATGLLADFRPVIYFECQRSHLGRTGGKPEDIWELLLRLGYVILAPRDGLYHVCLTVVDAVPSYLAVPIPPQGLGADRLSTEALIAFLSQDVPGRCSWLPAVAAPQTSVCAVSNHGDPGKEALELDR